MKRTIQGLMLLALIAVPVAFATACGGGGASSAKSVGDDALSAITGEKFDKLAGLMAEWDVNNAKQRHANYLWRIEKEKIKYKDNVEPFIKQQDPEGKAKIDSTDSFKSASIETFIAVEQGAYKIYKGKKLEDRLKAEWSMTDYSIRHGLEGDASASMTYMNKFNDSITVSTTRVEGKWYLDSVSVSFAENAEDVATRERGRGGRGD
ncbi:MAG: hypothetical protein IT461_11680 [Planctomycetes bacterium]|jgi:hypothetical protein|nr:hypothetical protein [Planctomycetota bacterium]